VVMSRSNTNSRVVLPRALQQVMSTGTAEIATT
jgi:hypothetical protein